MGVYEFRPAGQWHNLWGDNIEQRLKGSDYLVIDYSRRGEKKGEEKRCEEREKHAWPV